MNMYDVLEILVVKLRYINALLLRFGLIVLTDYLESSNAIGYTDIDYHVFTDGARHVVNFNSPYLRETYRYSPIMAYLMVPNLLIHRTVGKFMFAFVDVLVGLIIEIILIEQGKKIQEGTSLVKELLQSEFRYVCLFQLYNPLSISICTRGSSDSMTLFMILLVIYLVEKRRPLLAGLVYGFTVHFRIYPVVYSVSLVFYIYYKTTSKRPTIPEIAYDDSGNIIFRICRLLTYYWRQCVGILQSIAVLLFNVISNSSPLLFILGTIVSFSWCTILFYVVYGNGFLYEALIYHLVRRDHRHNFSLYGYMLYLTYSDSISKVLSIAVFAPQAILIGLSSVFLAKSINLCLVVITMIFVHFNKVITAQYFLWYFGLFPLILRHNSFFRSWIGLGALALWFGIELGWNVLSHSLEQKGVNLFLELFAANVLFFMVSCFILIGILRHHESDRMEKRSMEKKIE